MIYVQQQSSRGDLQERRSASKKQTHMSKLRRSRSQQNCFDILLKSHQRTDAPPGIRSTPQTTSLQENTSGRKLLLVKRV